MFSIIIPSLNNYDYLKICIESLLKNSKFNNQIIVHINVGSDKTKDFLIHNNIDFTYTENNCGLCKGVNLAAKKSQHEYIIYSHDDFYFCPNWDEPIVNEINKIGHKKFYLSSTLINAHGVDELDCGLDYSNFDEKKLLEIYSKFNFPSFQGSTWAPHVVHKDLWNKVKGFSEEFFPGAGSDPDFNFKLWMEEVRIFKTVSDSKVYHFESKTLRDKNKFIFFDNKDLGSKSSKIFLKKWGVSIKFFKKYYLNSNTVFLKELTDPKININYLFDFLICKLKLIYLKLFK